MDIDLERMAYIYEKSNHPEKENLYIKALENYSITYAPNPHVTDASIMLAQWYANRAAKYNPLIPELYQWEYKKALAICEEAITKYPDSRGAVACNDGGRA